MSDTEQPGGEFILYTTEDGKARVACRFENETIWLSQALMAELFETTPQNVTLHLKALYEDGELEEGATCKDYLQVRREGSRDVRRQVKHYNLEAIRRRSALEQEGAVETIKALEKLSKTRPKS